MKTYLESDEINLNISRPVLEETHRVVQGIYRADKSQAYQNFYCVAVIKTMRIGPKKSPITLLVNNENNVLVWDLQPSNYHLLSKKLFPSAREKRQYAYIHVLIEKRIFYYDRSYEASHIVTKPGQKTLGYYSNSSVLDEKGLSFLKDIYINRKKFSPRTKRMPIVRLHYLLIKSSELFANLFHYQVTKKAA